MPEILDRWLAEAPERQRWYARACNQVRLASHSIIAIDADEPRCGKCGKLYAGYGWLARHVRGCVT